jgi:excisionase family DNA binding protein
MARSSLIDRPDSLPAKLWSEKDLAQAWGVSPEEVVRLVREGRLAGIRLSPRRWRFRPEDVEDYLARQRWEVVG